MPEAEDVLTDAVRHLFAFGRALWQRSQPASPDPAPEFPAVAQRLALLSHAVFGSPFKLHVANAPAPPTLLRRFAYRNAGPMHEQALPSAYGNSIWLPRRLPGFDAGAAITLFRLMALQQGMRVRRMHGAVRAQLQEDFHVQEIYLVLEAAASDLALARWLPGIAAPLNGFRQTMLGLRPPLEAFPPRRRPIEELARNLMREDCRHMPVGLDLDRTSTRLYAIAQRLADELGVMPQGSYPLLFKDYWTGEFHQAETAEQQLAGPAAAGEDMQGSVRSTRLQRRPHVRKPEEGEDDAKPGPWMVQTSQPQEHAEDAGGMQRPVDRDEQTAAEEFADSLSELPEARLITAPGRPKEILQAEDGLELHGRQTAPRTSGASAIRYPEWDCRSRQYNASGAWVHVAIAVPGPAAWPAAILAKHAARLKLIRRQFELMRACRVRRMRQMEGDEIDLTAYLDGIADYRAGQAMPQALYQKWPPLHRELAVALLVDVSGSTDGWVSAHRRIIDVEREALILVCEALDSLGEKYSVQTFSGESAAHVTVRRIKDFSEAYGEDTRLRIAGLEPESYTRVGAAIRHVASELMCQSARHRLLLLLSDGKPNDVDLYEGRYGVEDTRQAVLECRQQGIFPFCLTIDRCAPEYLAHVFGPGRYALLPNPDLLPMVLLEWMKRLMHT